MTEPVRGSAEWMTLVEREAVVEGYRMMWRWWRRLRLYLGCWIVGGDYFGVVMRLWLIRERAMRAVGADGRVTLADCAPLAEVLYEPMPGKWSMTLTSIPDTNESTQTTDSAPSSGESP